MLQNNICHEPDNENYVKSYSEKIEDQLEVTSIQYDFKKGTGTRNEIFPLRMIMERYLGTGNDVHMIFIDFTKASDNVMHDKFMAILKQKY